ncbi:MAG: serine hydrolase [Ruminococcaceae bacterium]|nr:serine hydrolase [Oscillospiraceae bacterium]MBO4973018.1 serine hydrolase [Clostridia bacterium]
MKDLLNTLCNYVRENEINMFDIAVCDRENTERVVFVETNPCQNSYSVTKLFCVTAMGMLYDDGLVTPDMTVGEIFKDEIKSYGIDENKWSGVTVDHVLTHKIGFDAGFLDIDTEDASKYPTDDFLYLVLSHELALEPGSKYVYSDAAYYLASRIITKLSGEKLDELLMRRLLLPLKVRESAFSKCPLGYPIGATGLYIRTADMLKLGRVYLDGGVYNGTRIISEEWIDIVLTRSYELRPYGHGYTKGGMRGQRLYINPNTGVAVAWHSFDRAKKTEGLRDLL